MAVPHGIIEFLERKGVAFEALSHAETHSSVEEAGALGIEAGEVAKVIVVHHAGGRALFVLPAANRIAMGSVRAALEDKHARFATEEEMERDLPGYALGSAPPFGELVGATAFLDDHLANHETIVFAAGTHADSIRMKVSDLKALGKYTPIEVCRTAE